MAEIKIEKKKTIWPWVLIGLIILAILAYFLFFKDKNEDVVALTPPSDYTTAMQNPPKSSEDAVAIYVTFIENDTASMSLGHDYSHAALSRLVDATEQTANNNDVDISENLNKANTLSDKITRDEESTTHADDIKEAAKIISSALASIQQTKFPDLKSEVNELMIDADAIDVEDLTLDQKGTVKGFFISAKDAIKKMNNY